MSTQDRVRWDEIYTQRARQPYPAPDPLLLRSVPPAQPDQRALDLAAGFGQNGLWLAQQGYTTDIVDISRIALKRARAEMSMRNLRNVNLLQMDFDQLELEANHYDVLCVFRYLRRDLLPLLKLALRPGGRVIYETFNRRYLERVPQFNPDFLLDVGELAAFFDGWQVLHHESATYNEQLVAIKPPR